ncbi:MAG: undecaprenyl-phosphate glucose phosphotransferase [Methyloprofundus sp.]|nr:undecaprenyl-phosphate glucose phosphotransferase [Methyloprofundus sp.]
MGTVSVGYNALIALSILLIIISYQHTAQYKYNKSYTRALLSRLKAWSFVLFILLFIGFITKGMNYYSREVLLIWASTAYILQVINSFIFIRLTPKVRQKYLKKSNALVIGASHTAQRLITSVNNDPLLGHRVIGYMDNIKSDAFHDAPYLGDLKKLDDIIKNHDIKTIYIALPNHKLDQLEPLYAKLVLKDIDLQWAPDINTLNLINHHVKEISGMPVLTLSELPLAGEQLFIKSFFDLIATTIILLFISPILLLTAFLIKITSPGPVLFCQDRHGRNNEVFKIYKFRSMKVHQEVDGQVTQAKKEDDRVTSIGRFIRRTSIDELPQLFNVLKGDMSLVGPRPHAIAHNDYYQQQIDNYLKRHRIKPGITGLAQITGFRGETDTIEKMDGRVRQDILYINNWSLSLDIEIILKTFFSLILHKAH